MRNSCISEGTMLPVCLRRATYSILALVIFIAHGNALAKITNISLQSSIVAQSSPLHSCRMLAPQLTVLAQYVLCVYTQQFTVTLHGTCTLVDYIRISLHAVTRLFPM